MDHQWFAGKAKLGQVYKEGHFLQTLLKTSQQSNLIIEIKTTHNFTPTTQADWACLLANTSDGKPHQNKSLIVVPMDAKGITKSAISKMGMHVGLCFLKSFACFINTPGIRHDHPDL